MEFRRNIKCKRSDNTPDFEYWNRPYSPYPFLCPQGLTLPLLPEGIERENCTVRCCGSNCQFKERAEFIYGAQGGWLSDFIVWAYSMGIWISSSPNSPSEPLPWIPQLWGSLHVCLHVCLSVWLMYQHCGRAGTGWTLNFLRGWIASLSAHLAFSWQDVPWLFEVCRHCEIEPRETDPGVKSKELIKISS